MLESVRVPPPILGDAAPLPPREAASAPLTLNFFLDIFRRRRVALVLCVAVLLGLAAAYILVTPKKYAATATLLIDTRLAQLSQTEASATVVDQAAVESQIELLRSEKMLSSVIDKMGLLDDPEFGKPVGDAAKDEPVTAEVARQRALAILGGNLGVFRVGRSYLVSVTYSSPDPVKAAHVANEVAGAYISDQIGAKVQAAKDQNAWLDAQVSEMRSRAAQAYRGVQEFKAAHDVDPFGDLGIQQDLNRMAGEASRARAATVASRARLDAIEALLASPDHAAGAFPGGADLRALADPQVEQLAERYARLPAPAAPGDPTAADAAGAPDARSERSGMAEALWARLSTLGDRQRAAWMADTATQRTAEATLADLRLRDTRARLQQERLRELETEAATSRSLYESYLNQLTHAAQQQPVPASDTRVISPAAVPLYPSTPKKLLTVALAAMAGVALGLAVTFALENLDDVIRTRDRLETATDLACIGVVPRMRRGLRRGGRLTPTERLRHGLPRLGAAGARSRAVDTLRSLQLAADGEARARGAAILGITSAVAGEGKTTIAYNLALSASHAGRRVLLVDANLRNPTVTLMVRPGESGPVPSLDLRQSVATGDGFDVVPASAQHTIDGAELPDAALLNLLLAEARDAYDLVIVDLPPILPLSEVRAVVPQVDALVLVARWGSTTTMQVQRALVRLGGPERLMGTVLNAVRPRKMRHFEGSTHRAYADLT